MNTSKYIQFSLLILIGSSAYELNAQTITSSSKRIADNYFNRSDYASAAKYYEQSIVATKAKDAAYVPYQVKRDKEAAVPVKISTRHESLYRLAESYRLLNDFAHAEPWYKMLLEEAPGAFPLAELYYGISQRANGKYPEAEISFKQFLQSYSIQDAFREQAQQELNNCVFIQEQLKNARPGFTITKLENTINIEGANYAAGWQENNTLVFTSTRADGNKKNGKPIYTNALYSATLQAGVWSNVARLNIPSDKEIHQGVATFTPDGNRMFFTVWSTDKQGKKASSVYQSDKKDTTWQAPVKLSSEINPEGSDSRQPHMTSDGKFLFFASDRAGGAGGFDIWYAPVAPDGAIGTAVNAGTVINTAKDDEAPFYHIPTGTLVFASNGRTGMGGFDLYYSKGDMQAWSVPENAGYPVNSIKDDLYFISKGPELWSDVLLSSDRASLCCLEMFSVAAVKTVPPPVVVKTEPEPVVTDPAVITEKAIREAYENKTSLVTQAILFAFNESTLADSSHAYLDTVAAYLVKNPEVKFEIGAHTDGKGSEAYNLKLSNARAMGCIDYLVKAGVSRDRLIAKGYGECCPIEKETTEDGKDIPEARAKNRRVEMKLY